MAEFVPISEAKARLSEIVRESDSEDVLLLRHGRPAAVVVSTRRYNALLEEIEDLKDRLSVHEREDVTVGLDKVIAELGLKGPLKDEP
jgi:prevent-host-death family protein